MLISSAEAIIFYLSSFMYFQVVSEKEEILLNCTKLWISRFE